MTVTEPKDPIAEFKGWLTEAEEQEPINPNAAALVGLLGVVLYGLAGDQRHGEDDGGGGFIDAFHYRHFTDL